jgi:anti-sigma regulatory factor (Ser/Thr protein kinase)
LRLSVRLFASSVLEASVKLVLPSDPRFGGVVRGAVEQFAAAFGVPESEHCALALAVQEAVTNIIRHAYGNRHDQPIELTCSARADTLEFVLLDEGTAADPARFRARPLGEVRIGGFGTHIMAQVMDEVQYERLPNRNQLRMVKHLDKVDRAVQG